MTRLCTLFSLTFLIRWRDHVNSNQPMNEHVTTALLQQPLHDALLHTAEVH